MTKSVQKFTQFLNFISYKYNLKFDKLTEDLNEYLKSESESFDHNYFDHLYVDELHFDHQ